MLSEAIQELLDKTSGMNVKLRINNNRSTMLSVKWEPDCTRVSLHRMFLKAPQNVMEELACYLRREQKSMTPRVKAFINENLRKLDYSHQLDPNLVVTKGAVYDLQEIYDAVNGEYFDGKICLSITWYGDPGKRNRSRVTFGLYHDNLRLIKIHRRLDSHGYPLFFVTYVVYHEMLHYVCPPYVDENGLERIHNTEFKSREKLFTQYQLAQQWMRTHREDFFM